VPQCDSPTPLGACSCLAGLRVRKQSEVLGHGKHSQALASNLSARNGALATSDARGLLRPVESVVEQFSQLASCRQKTRCRDLDATVPRSQFIVSLPRVHSGGKTLPPVLLRHRQPVLPGERGISRQRAAGVVRATPPCDGTRPGRSDTHILWPLRSGQSRLDTRSGGTV